MANPLTAGTALFFEILYCRLTGARKPLYVNFQITKHCNLRCGYCYADLESLRDKEELSTEEILALIDKLATMGTRWVRVVGGEPLMRKDIYRIVDKFAEKNIIVELVTNGTLLKQHLPLLKKVHSVCISIDGNRRATEKCRGKGTYDRALEAIEAAHLAGANLRLHAVLTKYSIGSLDELAELAKKYGAAFNYSQYQATDEARIGDFVVTPAETSKFFARLGEMKRRGHKVLNSDAFFDHVLNWPAKDSDVIYKKDKAKYDLSKVMKCNVGTLSCWIDSDGGIYGCPAMWKRGINMRDAGFEKAWDNLAERGCYSCHANGDVEACAILGLERRALFNAAKAVLLGNRG
ncbi:MAG: radical SAM protein [Candidatus Diapherotrites archaeon]